MNDAQVLSASIVLATLALLLGAVVGAFARDGSLVESVVDGFTRGAVPCVVALRVLPDLVGQIGGVAIVLALLGYAALRTFEGGDHGTPRLAVGAVVLALAVHSLIDGASLSLFLPLPEQHLRVPQLLLAGAVIGHRSVEGLVVSRMMAPHVGGRRALQVIAALALVTGAAACGGRALRAWLPMRALAVAVALGAGVLVRVVLHRPLAGRCLTSIAGLIGGAAVGCGAALMSD